MPQGMAWIPCNSATERDHLPSLPLRSGWAFGRGIKVEADEEVRLGYVLHVLHGTVASKGLWVVQLFLWDRLARELVCQHRSGSHTTDLMSMEAAYFAEE